MSNPSRRQFVVRVVAVGAALAAARASAQAPGKVEESDPQAVGLGYKADTTKIDQARFASHTAAQACASCNFFQGKAGDALGPCQLFAGKQVSAKGWCSGYSKKAA